MLYSDHPIYPDHMIYLDHSATTPVDPRVRDAMLPYFTEIFGNPSSLHRYGQQALAAVDDARQTVADILGVQTREIVFTANGTEAKISLCAGLRCRRVPNPRGKNHIITTPIEHHAILRTCEQLEREFDFEITYVPVNRHGVVILIDVACTITDRTSLISVMYANNEVGTIEPLAEIGKLARGKQIYFHTDAVQAGGYCDLDVERLNVDLMSLGSHKFHGPKGVGVLYIKNGVKILPTQTGGSQERGRRAGTENVPYIVGFAKALELMQGERETTNAKLRSHRERLVERLLEAIPALEADGSSLRTFARAFEFCHSRRGGRRDGVCARFGGRCGFDGLGMHGGFARTFACARCDGLCARPCARRAACYAGS